MQVERIAPRTWLLAATAAWALGWWVLALAGLVGQARLLPADPALLQPLPAVPEDAGARLQPLSAYAVALERPLLTSDRRPHPFVLEGRGEEGDAPARAAFDYQLTSVLIAPPLRMAVLQPAGGGEGIRVRLGGTDDALSGWRLVALAPRSAVFEGPGGRRTLALRTFDGTGGEPASHVPAAGERQRAIEASAAAQAEQASEDAAAQATIAPQADPPPQTNQARRQADAIRKRIEARRAQMRREATQSTANDRKP